MLRPGPSLLFLGLLPEAAPQLEPQNSTDPSRDRHGDLGVGDLAQAPSPEPRGRAAAQAGNVHRRLTQPRSPAEGHPHEQRCPG